MPSFIKPYLTGLFCVAESATCTALARVVDHASHDRLSRILKNKKLEWQTLLSNLVLRISGKLQNGWLILDDTVLDKSFAKVIENLAWIYSSKEERVVLGLNVVVLAWSNGTITIPLGIKIWKKADGRSKYELARELLAYAKNTLKIKPDFVLFDSWYGSAAILGDITSYGWTFVCQLKKNRLLNGTQLRKFKKHPYWMARGKLQGGIEVSVVRHGGKYFATNDFTLTKAEIFARYDARWAIETMFRFLYDQLGIEECQSISLQCQTAHIHLCLIAHALVEKAKEETNRTGYEIIRSCRFNHANAENLLSMAAFGDA
jgi:hypothetical protein